MPSAVARTRILRRYPAMQPVLYRWTPYVHAMVLLS